MTGGGFRGGVGVNKCLGNLNVDLEFATRAYRIYVSMYRMCVWSRRMFIRQATDVGWGKEGGEDTLC